MHASSNDQSGVRVFPPAIYLAGLLVGFGIQWLWPIPIAPAAFAFAVRLFGIAFLGAWLALAISAVLTFKKVGTTPHPMRPTTALALAGPYRFTRNPMYLSFVFMNLGVALVANALWPVAVIPAIMLIVQRVVIEREEHYLTTKFGQEYIAFKARVRRWL
ncbi:MAG TPA: isoprenylcysteine carboxylmethyltransferase family protein [Thermoanaerobaculia bacterium]|nr:isoprenylcysteine carboxylmethyltransferase family protein [Thermoanaerobaculia bacterium]